jgi:hypothetical protein
VLVESGREPADGGVEFDVGLVVVAVALGEFLEAGVDVVDRREDALMDRGRSSGFLRSVVGQCVANFGPERPPGILRDPRRRRP